MAKQPFASAHQIPLGKSSHHPKAGSGRATASPTRREGGFATAEMAMALPVVTLVLAAAIWSISAMGTHIRAVDAAYSGAIAAARGEDATVAASSYVPAGSAISLTESHNTVTVTVEVPIRPLGGLTPDLSVSSSATASKEPRLPVEGNDEHD
ncbi:TadE family type IV pilus minor pilin [Natronoglycomyces albus]|uniref:Mucin-associated surface protein n=1 Tax=Natronoglycomyces albus TaxID=2811108 RepID=A0A895XNV9_9ACTN|nr:TadE family type IV pilus minor pilin [Natronoglycomyces albus]QSB05452.1 mucin-associated surface protein [Natronoglycomyces albus]